MKKTGKSAEDRFKEFKDFKKKYPAFVGGLGTEFFKQSFVRQGFIPDNRVDKWDKRNQVKGKDADPGRAILVKSGALKRSVRVTDLKPDKVSWGSDKPYAQIHNEGGEINATEDVRSYWRKHRTNKPLASGKGKSKRKTVTSMIKVRAFTRKVHTKIKQRQFMGESKLLMKRIEMQTIYQLKKIFE